MSIGLHRFGRHRCYLLAGCIAFGVPTITLAQTAPDAGALRQQIERENRPSLPKRGVTLKPAETTALSLPDGARVRVREFRFAGNTLIPGETLHAAVRGYLGRDLGFTELQQAAAAVAQAYRDAGWIVRTYLPKQEVTDGVITIQIVEAVYGGTVHEGEPPKRVRLSQVMGAFEARQKTGAPINVDALDRALLLADDLPGVAVVGALREGKESGETELVLKLTDEPLLIGEASLDNQGARSTGEVRAGLAMQLNSPLRLGDLLSFNAIGSRGYDYYRAAYTLPVGHDGWRVGVNTSWLNYHLVGNDFAALQAKGNSTSVGVDATYPLIRSRLSNLYLNLGYERKNFRNEAMQTVQSDYRVDDWTVNLSGNLFDTLGGGGANAMSLGWTYGRVDHGTLDAGENPALAGHFDVLRYSLSRQQTLSTELSLFAQLTGQHAGKELDSSERFALGGPTGVRAYPGREGSGRSGQLANVELRWRLPHNVTLTGFYDWGRVAASNTPRYSLKGYGASVAWQTPMGLALKLTWARRDGENPNPAPNGRDQDGSLDRNRLWASVTLPF
ncbi:MAG TPA: ShlB/FhaC/HecB family hemolysin secretion/activation protein [Accumulibacter sp.]|nr:ShlB/FhaC/HecB family hemolysin secretion/activation protein [Accumulibacter sp.]HMW16988.1 ShlB/FhaC/HecB family hemolysin secretion/activation protein [Accumulibacter sp.]HMX21838.1 ShlB/FhaC/HecB family hemolysin secretion/activation protein [Accumulibacter sp.]HNC17240.1 ShlB/FhaC/HecB family hemolysin secretion/activation protein [Accumulibacter sp.]HND79866.1 ShlB/FhaC/HecB family hemolysin secretion/activation protein [Accumulibacter sp.]